MELKQNLFKQKEIAHAEHLLLHDQNWNGIGMTKAQHNCFHNFVWKFWQQK